MKNVVLLTALLLAPLAEIRGEPIELEQIISRENPLLDKYTGHGLALGRDGCVYVHGRAKNQGFILRVSLDGSEKFGQPIKSRYGRAYAITGVAANADGVIASSQAHFAKAVRLYDRDFNFIEHVSGFIGNDDVGWNAPGNVEVGASGDFYGLDQHTNTVLRIDPKANVVRKLPIEAEVEPGRSDLRSFRFRVCEQTESFFFDTREGVRCSDFEGHTRWIAKAQLGGNPYNGWQGSFDVDDDGTLFVTDGVTTTLQRFDKNGQPDGQITLRMPEPPDRFAPVSHVRVRGQRLVLRTKSSRELFQVYNLSSGKRQSIVHIDHERLVVRLGDTVCTAGESIPLEIVFRGMGPAIQPDLRAWFRPLGTLEFQQLPLKDGQGVVPADAGGLYHLRVTSGLNGAESEYQVQTVVEIRPPGAKGSLSIFTPLNRRHYAAGERIPVSVVLRSPGEQPAPPSVKLMLLRKGQAETIWHETVSLKPNEQTTTEISGNISKNLTPGDYRITVDLPGWTIAPQFLTMGPELTPAPLSIVRHGDYYTSFPEDVTLWNAPERVAQTAGLEGKLGTNLIVDRLGHGGSGRLFGTGRPLADQQLVSRLKSDPAAVAPEKARFEDVAAQSIAAYGAGGIQEQAILLYMDAGLPIGTGFDKRTPEKMVEDVKTASTRLSDYAAFRGWSWAANWWFGRRNARLQKSNLPPEKVEAYNAALKEAEENGKWSPILEEVSDIWLSWPIEAERLFDEALQVSAPGKISAMTAPYRQPMMIPPLVFQNADELDLHFQGEQIQWPQISPFNVDFYKRPGKRAWAHPELKNDDGTGGMIYPTLFQLLMRGGDGIGQSGRTGSFRSPMTHPRGMGQGAKSIHRAVNQMALPHAEFLTSLETVNPIAIPVSTRMMRIEEWGGVGGWYFTRIFEAYQSCLYAHRPAKVVFVEDLDRHDLTQFESVLVVSQTVELDKRFADALKKCQRGEIPIFYDGTTRVELMKPFAARPLGITFDRVEKDPHVWQDDVAYLRFQEYFTTHAAKLSDTLPVKPIAGCDNPEVLLSELRTDDGKRVLWAVNNTLVPLDPARMWRVSLAITNRLPVVEQITWDVAPDTEVIELFSGRKMQGDRLVADLRTLPARVFVVDRSAIRTSDRGAIHDATIGAHLRDLAISQDGSTALINAANWDQNLYAVNLSDGSVRYQTKVGHHFAYAPQATSDGFAVQGMDLNSAEGYHLYLTDKTGQPARRFALYGLPKKATNWAAAALFSNMINNFASSPDSSWFASAGDLGVAVWSHDGKLLWSDDSWRRNQRKRVHLLASDSNTLLTLSGSVVTAVNPKTGEQLWSHILGETGMLDGAVASADGQTIALRSSAEGGRVYVLRGGQPANTLLTSYNEVAISPDGHWIAVTEEDQLRLYHATGGLRWSMTADDLLRYPRFAPDNRLAVGSEIGTLFVLDVDGRLLHSSDQGALPVTGWLPNGDLIVATWLGKLRRLDADYQPVWSTVLQPDIVVSPESLLAADNTPTSRIGTFGNAAEKPASLTENLLSKIQFRFDAIHDPPAHADPRPWHHDIKRLFDGDPTPPEQPWLHWTDVNYVDSGWRKKLTLVLDTFRTQLRVTGITIVEDPNRSESWQRDLHLQYWDADAGTWQDGVYLLSDCAVHTHWFDEPIEAAKFRFVSTGGGTWPYQNLRWGELVFHGELLGASHPDAVAERPVAVLFDESQRDVESLDHRRDDPFEFIYDQAFSGSKSMGLTREGAVKPRYVPPWGHMIPNWDFPIRENPKPGEYRWLQLTWKATSPQTKAMKLFIDGFNIFAGEEGRIAGQPHATEVRVSESVPADWTTVRLDLWKTAGKPIQLRHLGLGAKGGGMLLDRALLGRTENDLETLSNKAQPE